ncbi:hypothetical protein L1994_10325 [Methanomicrobium antiquum]|uniref:Uncharacterized protein n=1 Tax=Methanomicrobium antiquum TaxID=487686 RepID=A0AAF0FQ12_9EURY|nr:hypothetical protein [Methanomicrobium antiquum]MDD3976737.1 hypothetical protein [Methanomicrobium sp.]WFN36524.1 hypothetical protein L1994_10325 [Methanomicrobium antiquum]
MLRSLNRIICIPAVLLTAVFLLCLPVSAVVSEVTDGNLLNSQNEGELIQYTIDVSAIPKQARTIVLSTDLTPVAGNNLWQPQGEGFLVSGGNNSINEQKIELYSEDGFSEEVIVTVYGRAPVLTAIEVVDGVVVTKPVTKTTGYIYYHVQALDENNDILGTSSTETFSIVIPGEEQFKERLNAVSDTNLRGLIDSLYRKGLRDEANDLLTYAESPKDASLPLTTAVIIGIVLFVIGLAIGVILGQIRARNMQDFQSEY